MSEHMEFYIQDDAASIQIGKNVYKRVSIPIDDFNAACDHYGFVMKRTCRNLSGDFAVFSCSECGYFERDCACANYCPNCGARVIKSDQYL